MKLKVSMQERFYFHCENWMQSDPVRLFVFALYINDSCKGDLALNNGVVENS